jgi:dual-specificity kinase
LVNEIAKGGFGAVFKAHDYEVNKTVAIKIPRRTKHSLQFFSREKDILSMIKKNDTANTQHCVQMIDRLEIEKSKLPCAVFEFYETNALDLMLINSKTTVPLPLQQIKSFAKQLLIAIRFLHDDLHIIHADVKPDNVLVKKSPKDLNSHINISLGDFGLSFIAGRNKNPANWQWTQNYISPEALVKEEFGFPADMFALGCTLMEFHTGKYLFDSINYIDHHLAQMQSILGKLPDRFFIGKEKLKSNVESVHTKEQGLASLVLNGKALKNATPLEVSFLDFVKQLLDPDPRERLTASRALFHPFLINPTF